jgi:hypothetical protein
LHSTNGTKVAVERDAGKFDGEMSKLLATANQATILTMSVASRNGSDLVAITMMPRVDEQTELLHLNHELRVSLVLCRYTKTGTGLAR